MSNPAKLFIKNTAAAMNRMGLTQTELAERTGLSRPQITNYLAGKNTPGLEAIESIAKVLGVEADWLISDHSKPISSFKDSRIYIDRALDLYEGLSKINPKVLEKLLKVDFDKNYLEIETGIEGGLAAIELVNRSANENQKKKKTTA